MFRPYVKLESFAIRWQCYCLNYLFARRTERGGEGLWGGEWLGVEERVVPWLARGQPKAGVAASDK